MDAAIACLERELATLATNFAATADALVTGQDPGLVDPRPQQDSRWRQMVDLQNALGHLNTRAKWDADCLSQIAQSGQSLGNVNAQYAANQFATGPRS
jgi:hypothetical protein